MKNEDYYELMKKKPFEEKLREFGHSIERMKECQHEAVYGPTGERDYYSRESMNQSLRVEFLYQLLKEEREPVKPEWKETDLGIFGKSIHPHCSRCGWALRFRHGDETPIDKFCSGCGAEIDWSEEEIQRKMYTQQNCR